MLHPRRLALSLVAVLAVSTAGCGAADVVGNVQQCTQVGAAVAKVSVIIAGSQATGADLTSARDALGSVGDVPEPLAGPFATLEEALNDPNALDSAAVQSAYDEIRTWVETECVPGTLGDLLPGG